VKGVGDVKKIISVLILAAAVAAMAALFIGCGQTTFSFPDDSNLWRDRQRLYNDMISKEWTRHPVDFDFYVQGTSFMAGFVSDRDSCYARILMAATSTANSADLIGRARNSAFFRFGAVNRELDAAKFQPFSISNVQFENEALISREFYSVAWHFDQDGRQGGRFHQHYTNENRLAERPDRVYYEDLDPTPGVRGGYLRGIFEFLNEDNISVIFTDFVDAGFHTDVTIEWLGEYLAKDPMNAVALLAFRIDFDGRVSTLVSGQPSGLDYRGDRPFYVLVLGNIGNVEEYANALRGYLSGQGINGELLLLNSAKSRITAMNYVNSEDLTGVSPPEGTLATMPLWPLQRIQSGVLDMAERRLVTAENPNISDTLFFQLNNSRNIPNIIEFPLSVPFYSFGFWFNVERSLCESLSLVTDIYVSDRDSEWQSRNAAEVMQGSTAVVSSDGNNIDITLRINRAELRRITPSSSTGGVNRIRVGIRVENNVALSSPRWIDDFFHSGLNPSNPSIFGSHTVLPVSGLFTELINSVNDMGTENNIVADLLLYLVY